MPYKGRHAKRCLDCWDVYYTKGNCQACGSSAYWPEDSFLMRKKHEYPFHDIDLEAYPPEKLRNEYLGRYAQ